MLLDVELFAVRYVRLLDWPDVGEQLELDGGGDCEDSASGTGLKEPLEDVGLCWRLESRRPVDVKDGSAGGGVVDVAGEVLLEEG